MDYITSRSYEIIFFPEKNKHVYNVNRHDKGKPLIFLIITYLKDTEKSVKTGKVKTLEETPMGV